MDINRSTGAAFEAPLISKAQILTNIGGVALRLQWLLGSTTFRGLIHALVVS